MISAFDRNLQALSLFRIALSGYLLADYIINIIGYFGDFYTEDGILPLHLASHYYDGWPGILPDGFMSALSVVVEPIGFSVVYICAVIAFGFGYRTFFANLIVFVLHLYLYLRNPLILAGADQLAHLMLLWSLFLPLNRYWSFDSALEIGARDRPHSIVPFLAVKVQICSIYFFAALSKLSGTPWREGYALYWVLSDTAFGATGTARFLVENLPALLGPTTYMVIVFQLAFTLLVFAPWRPGTMRFIALGGAAAMHLSFIFCLDIGSFPYLSLVILLVLVPDQWIDRALRRRRARLDKVTIFHEPGCEFCRKIALLFREFLLSPAAPVLPASDDPEALKLLEAKGSWVVRDPHGESHIKWPAVTYLLVQNPLLRPVGHLMALRMLRRPLEVLYDTIGRNRRPLGGLTRVLVPVRKERPLGKFGITLCAALALLGFATNVHSAVRLAYGETTFASVEEQPAVLKLADVIQIKQRWHLFAPVPVHFKWLFQIQLLPSDGPPTNLMALLPEPLFTIAEDGSKVRFANGRWLKYLTQLNRFNARQVDAFGIYLCREAAKLSVSRQVPVYDVELLARAENVDKTIVLEEPQATQRHFDCA